MATLLGTRDLGLTVQWSFGFVGHGTSATTTPGVVYLDVGNRLCAGVLDQHQDVSLGGCTSELLVSHPEYVYHHLLGEVLALHARGQLPPGLVLNLRIVTHRDPDWDGMVSTFLVQRLVEDGELPPYAPALVAYAKEVDQGRFSVRRYLEAGEVGLRALSLLPHLAALVLAHHHRGRHAEVLAAGLELVRATIAGLEKAVGAPWTWPQDTFETRDAAIHGAAGAPAPSATPPPEHPSAAPTTAPGLRPGAGAWAEAEPFVGFPQRIVEDLDTWKAESADGAREPVLLPVDGAGGGVSLQAVPALVLRRPSRSMLNKYWARAEGYPLFVCPYGGKDDGPLAPDAVAPRVIVSLPDDPGSWPTGVRPAHLRGLGALLEREETRLRVQLGKRRVGRPRWDDAAYCDNTDPWYDGRGHAFRILDAPRAGTVLPYAALVAHLRDARAWAPLDVVLDALHLDLHLVVPDDGLRLEGMEAPPLTASGGWGAGGLSSTLRTWASHTRVTDVASTILALLPAPRGVRVARVVRRDIVPVAGSGGRVFPRMVQVTLERDEAATEFPRLGEVLDWVVAVERALSGAAQAVASGEASPDRAFLTLSWAPSPAFRGSTDAVERVVRRVGATALRTDGTRIGPRVIVRQWGQLEADGVRLAETEHRVLAEMLGYVAFLDATLSRVSQQIALAVLGLEGSTQGGEPPVAVSDVRNEFLLFQGLYFQPEVSANPRVQQTCDDVRGALQLDTHYREVESELDRLAQVETARADERMGTVMEILTLVSLVGTVDAIVQGINEGMGDAHNWLRAGVAIATLVCVISLRQFFRVAPRASRSTGS